MSTLNLILSAIVIAGTVAIFLLRHILSKKKEQKQIIKDTDMDDPSSITRTFDKLRFIIIFVILFVSSCSTVVIHPISGLDIIPLKKGEQISWYDIKTGLKYEGAPKDGQFFSKEYIEDVMGAKVKE